MFFKWVGWIHLNSELLDFEVISWNILIYSFLDYTFNYSEIPNSPAREAEVGGILNS